jgi:hypothetical protein
MEILKTRKNNPPRILIHADHGLGKSSLGAAAPNPIFIQTEDGLENIDTNAFPLCKDFQTVLEQLSYLYAQPHEFNTLVLDSLDWCETLIAQHVCKEGNKQSISDFGYGAGFQAMLEQFGRIIKALTAIREERGMIIVLIAHSQIKEYGNPLGSNYDRHCIKLREKNAELFLEWADLVGFLHFSVFTNTKKDGFSETTKALGGVDRVLSCSPSAAYVSKNRYGITNDISIPDPITGWNNIVSTIKGEK